VNAWADLLEDPATIDQILDRLDESARAE
jgi:hypothetical protein